MPCRFFSATWDLLTRRLVTTLKFVFLIEYKSFEEFSCVICNLSLDIVVKTAVHVNKFRSLIYWASSHVVASVAKINWSRAPYTRKSLGHQCVKVGITRMDWSVGMLRNRYIISIDRYRLDCQYCLIDIKPATTPWGLVCAQHWYRLLLIAKFGELVFGEISEQLIRLAWCSLQTIRFALEVDWIIVKALNRHQFCVDGSTDRRTGRLTRFGLILGTFGVDWFKHRSRSFSDQYLSYVIRYGIRPVQLLRNQHDTIEENNENNENIHENF